MGQQPTVFWVAKRMVYLLLFWFFAAFFVLYISGVRINWQNWRLIESSSIAITERYNRKLEVDIVLNGELQHANLPIVINQITPNNYTLTVEVAGYHTWQHSFCLQSGKAIQFNEVLFIPNVLESREANKAEQQQVAETAQMVSRGLLIRDRELFDVTTEEERLIVRMSEPIEQALWYPRQTHIVFRAGKTIAIMENDGTNIVTLITLAEDGPIKMLLMNRGRELAIQDDIKTVIYTIVPD